jgi:hypothetical protein
MVTMARTVVTGLLLAVLAAHVAHAAPSGPDMQGTFVLDPNASDNVHRAIDALVAQMGGLRGPIARMRPRDVNQPPQRIEVAYTATDVSITTDGQDTIRTPFDDQPVKWKASDGEEFTIRTVWDDRTMRRVFVADDGQRANTYVFSPDGATLRMSVVLTSPQLPGPLEYTLVYKRSGP